MKLFLSNKKEGKIQKRNDIQISGLAPISSFRNRALKLHLIHQDCQMDTLISEKYTNFADGSPAGLGTMSRPRKKHVS